MPWNATWPEAAKSVKANRTRGSDNMAYIQTTMGNTAVGINTTSTRDHFWNVGTNEDGRHRFIQSPAFTVGGNPTDPVLGTGMDAVAYAKRKTVGESTAQQDVQPFFRNASAIMQVLGIRACAVFDSAGTIVYKHNVSSVTNTGTGLFTVAFTTALPSNAYLVLGGGIRNDSNVEEEILFSMQGATSINTVKSTANVKIQFQSTGGSNRDPLQAWVMCFGG